MRRCPPRWRTVGVILALGAAAVFIRGELKTYRENWNGIHYAGIPGYTENSSRKSATMAYVRVNKDSLVKAGPIYSDAFEGLWFLADVRSDPIAHKDNPEDIRYMMHDDHFTIIWFDDAVNDDLIDINYMKSRKQLVRELHFNDGAIYFFRTTPTP